MHLLIRIHQVGHGVVVMAGEVVEEVRAEATTGVTTLINHHRTKNIAGLLDQRMLEDLQHQVEQLAVEARNSGGQASGLGQLRERRPLMLRRTWVVVAVEGRVMREKPIAAVGHGMGVDRGRGDRVVMVEVHMGIEIGVKVEVLRVRLCVDPLGLDKQSGDDLLFPSSPRFF